ncbi:hypothetical protein [Winogradskyella vincentii]|uniref:Uncharacterized protein n=1 Tax=Winogradskyella vincentii TaxID=2877122 RepID=A0ABS7Y4I9_9FLAO|nr:hypothetical protein [Winogradskyella vincentii]MCA0153762.1 hypothetical protein [Winogradskyella vincentii]
MRKAYLLVYSNSLGTREKVKNCLDKSNLVIHWRYDLPNAFYIISEDSANELSDMIRGKLGNGRFIVTEISSNKQGWLPRQTWDLINKKKRE